MKEILLSQGKVALVDDEDYEKVSVYKWYYIKSGYAVRNARKNEGNKIMYMHRLILGLDTEKRSIHADHKDHNKLNNTKDNLRICSHKQNQQNKIKVIDLDNTSKFKGVCWDKNRKKWAVQVHNGKQKYFRRFDNELDAAIHYNEIAKLWYGEFALLN